MRSDYPQATILGSQIRTLHSNVVDDKYELSIWLPSSYDTSNQEYPTLFVLDVPFFYGAAVSNVLLREGNVPEMIVVGIGNRVKSYDEWWPIRERDYAPVSIPGKPGSGHAAAFLSCIDQELIPFFDTNYRTQRDDRTIWGQSLGGIFALYAMYNQADLFNRYIVTAPSFVIDGKTLLDYQPALTTESFSSEVRLFVSVGSLDQDFGSYVETFMSTISVTNIPDFKFRTAILDGYTHTASAVPGFIQGLDAVFSL